jgi:hypothetical protein
MTPPELNPRAPRDPVLLGNVLDEWIRKNAPMRAAGRALLRHEKALRRRCDSLDPSGKTWRLFLKIDETHVSRMVDALTAAVVWAFRQGRRSRRSRGGR